MAQSHRNQSTRQLFPASMHPNHLSCRKSWLTRRKHSLRGAQPVQQRGLTWADACCIQPELWSCLLVRERCLPDQCCQPCSSTESHQDWALQAPLVMAMGGGRQQPNQRASGTLSHTKSARSSAPPHADFYHADGRASEATVELPAGPTLLVVCCVHMLPQADGDGQACRARLHPRGMSPMPIKATIPQGCRR